MVKSLTLTDTRESWFRLIIVFFIASVGNVGLWSIVYVMPFVEAEFGLARSQTSLPYSLTMIGFAVGNLIFGWLLDRYGLFLILIGATLLISLGYFSAVLSSSILIFSIIQFLIGLGTAVSFAPLMADISHWFAKYRGVALAVTASGNYFSGALSSLLLAETLEMNGWRVAYILLGAICFTIIIPLAFILNRGKTRSKNAVSTQDESNRSLGKDPFLSVSTITFLLCLAAISCCVAMSMPQVHIVSYCVDLGFGSQLGSQMLAAMLIGGVLSRLIFGFVADWLGGLRTVLISSALQCIALFLYLPFDGMVSLFAVSFIFGLSQGGIIPSYAVVVREFMPTNVAGSKIGLIIMCTIIGMASGGFLSGWIFDFTGSYQAAFINGIIWNFLNFLIIGFVFYLWKVRVANPHHVN